MLRWSAVSCGYGHREMRSGLNYASTWHHRHQSKASTLGGLASSANTVEAIRLLLMMMMAAQKDAKAEASVTEWDDVQIHVVVKRSCVALNMASGSGPPWKKFWHVVVIQH